MKTINLVHLKDSDIKYKLFTFPDGEPHIVLDEFDRKEDKIEIKCRISNPTDLFILMQVADILQRQEMDFYVNIYYLMSMRMDRVMSFNESFSLKVVTNILKTFKTTINILEPHSDKIWKLLKDYGSNSFNSAFEESVFENVDKFNIVFPDKGAASRYGYLVMDDNCKYVVFSKTRDLDTGKIKSFEMDQTHNVDPNVPFLVIDDLCDGGGTFAATAKVLRDKYPGSELNVFVTHMVNEKGIKTLSENFTRVIFTNSYRDWDSYLELPNNVLIINVI